MCDVTAKSAKNLTGMAPKEKYIYIEAGIKTFQHQLVSNRQQTGNSTATQETN